MKRYPPPPHDWVVCRGSYWPCAMLIASGIPVAEVRRAWSRQYQAEKRRSRMLRGRSPFHAVRRVGASAIIAAVDAHLRENRAQAGQDTAGRGPWEAGARGLRRTSTDTFLQVGKEFR